MNNTKTPKLFFNRTSILVGKCSVSCLVSSVISPTFPTCALENLLSDSHSHLPSRSEIDGEETQMEGDVSRVERDRGRSERERRPESLERERQKEKRGEEKRTVPSDFSHSESE